MSKIGALMLIATFGVTAAGGAESFRVKFINKTGEEHKGCVLMVWDKDGKRFMDGVRPVGGNETVTFTLPNCEDYTHWRFIASIKYSDDPDNFDTVLVDTEKRAISKCDYSVTGTKN